MTKIIAILNHKGGVGKTTTTINLAAALRQKKKRVLAIDMDGQANLTESCGLSIEEEQTVYGAMRGEYPLPVIELENGLAVVPSCLDLSAAAAALINEPGRELILKGLITKLLDSRKFDYILIDCPPSLSLLTLPTRSRKSCKTLLLLKMRRTSSTVASQLFILAVAWVRQHAMRVR